MTTQGTNTRSRRSASLAQSRSVRIDISGLTCAAEAVRLESGLRSHPGILGVVVNPVTEQAYVTYAPAQLSPEAIRQQIIDMGF